MLKESKRLILLRKDVRRMTENMKKRNEQLAKTVIKGLESRNMTGYYAKDKEDALKQALELIPEGSTIAMGGCMSATDIGLIDSLKEGDYNYIHLRKHQQQPPVHDPKVLFLLPVLLNKHHYQCCSVFELKYLKFSS